MHAVPAAFTVQVDNSEWQFECDVKLILAQVLSKHLDVLEFQ